MSQHSWTTCFEPERTQINYLLVAFKQLLDENLIGIYLHGSLAMGCFNPTRSDVDLLVVIQHGMSVETKRDMARSLLTCSPILFLKIHYVSVNILAFEKFGFLSSM